MKTRSAGKPTGNVDARALSAGAVRVTRGTGDGRKRGTPHLKKKGLLKNETWLRGVKIRVVPRGGRH